MESPHFPLSVKVLHSLQVQAAKICAEKIMAAVTADLTSFWYLKNDFKILFS